MYILQPLYTEFNPFLPIGNGPDPNGIIATVILKIKIWVPKSKGGMILVPANLYDITPIIQKGQDSCP